MTGIKGIGFGSLIFILFTIFNLYLIKKEKDKSHLVYKFVTSIFILFLIQENLFLNYFKIFFFAAICFVSWAGYTLYSQSKDKMKASNEVVNKVMINFTSIVAVLSQIAFYFFTGFDKSLIKYSEKEFLFLSVVVFISQAVSKIIIDNVLIKKVFYTKDKYRKLFTSTEAIFILIFTFEFIYSMINFKNFTFI